LKRKIKIWKAKTKVPESMKSNFILKFIFPSLFVPILLSCSSPTESITTLEKPRLHCAPESVMKDTVTASGLEKDHSAIGFELLKKETVGKIKMGLSNTQVVSILGEPDEKTAAQMWEADGQYHQVWQFTNKGVSLDLCNTDTIHLFVCTIIMQPPCVLKTMASIGVGSSYEETLVAYKDYIDVKSSDKSKIIAGSVYGGIIFSFENNKVSSIFMGAGAE